MADDDHPNCRCELVYFNDERRFVPPAEWARRLSEDFGDTDPWSKLADARTL
jgi:hypothetical protein